MFMHFNGTTNNFIVSSFRYLFVIVTTMLLSMYLWSYVVQPVALSNLQHNTYTVCIGKLAVTRPYLQA